jgi:hypothetical protein
MILVLAIICWVFLIGLILYQSSHVAMPSATLPTLDIRQIDLKDILLAPSDFSNDRVSDAGKVKLGNQYNGLPDQMFLDRVIGLDDKIDDFVARTNVIGLDNYSLNDFGNPVRTFTQELVYNDSSASPIGYLVAFLYQSESDAEEAYTEYFSTYCFHGKNVSIGDSDLIDRGAFCDGDHRAFLSFLKCKTIVDMYAFGFSSFTLEGLAENLIIRLGSLCTNSDEE